MSRSQANESESVGIGKCIFLYFVLMSIKATRLLYYFTSSHLRNLFLLHTYLQNSQKATTTTHHLGYFFLEERLYDHKHTIHIRRNVQQVDVFQGNWSSFLLTQINNYWRDLVGFDQFNAYLRVLHVDSQSRYNHLCSVSPGESCHVENRDLSTAHKVSLIWKIRKSQTDIAHDEEGTNYVIKVVLGEQWKLLSFCSKVFSTFTYILWISIGQAVIKNSIVVSG